jgi:hypothetical protein
VRCGRAGRARGRPLHQQQPRLSWPARLPFARAQVFAYLESVFPQWAANGFRLVHMSSGGQVQAPTPAEAAHALRGVAVASKRAAMSQVRAPPAFGALPLA